MRLSLRIEGLPAVERAFAVVRRRAALNIIRALARQRTAIKRELRRRVPRDTGALARSAFVRRKGRVVFIGYSAPYARAVRFRVPIEEATNCNEALRGYTKSHDFATVVRRAIHDGWQQTIREAQRS